MKQSVKSLFEIYLARSDLAESSVAIKKRALKWFVETGPVCRTISFCNRRTAAPGIFTGRNRSHYCGRGAALESRSPIGIVQHAKGGGA